MVCHTVPFWNVFFGHAYICRYSSLKLFYGADSFKWYHRFMVLQKKNHTLSNQGSVVARKLLHFSIFKWDICVQVFFYKGSTVCGRTILLKNMVLSQQSQTWKCMMYQSAAVVLPSDDHSVKKPWPIICIFDIAHHLMT